MGIIQSTEGLDRTKRQRKGKFALCLSWDTIFSCPWTLELLVLGPLDSDSFYHWLSQALRPFGLDWMYTTWSPGPPACRQPSVGLLILHNCVSQSLVMNLLLYIYIWSIGSISGKPWLVYLADMKLIIVDWVEVQYIEKLTLRKPLISSDGKNIYSPLFFFLTQRFLIQFKKKILKANCPSNMRLI